MENRLLRISEVATYLNTTAPTLYRWIASGRLRAVRFGRNLRIAEKEIQDFLQRERHYRDGDSPAKAKGNDAA